MGEGFSNKRKAGNLLNATIMTLNSLSMESIPNGWWWWWWGGGVRRWVTHTIIILGECESEGFLVLAGTKHLYQVWRTQAVRMLVMQI
jgi:hypothetical protein